MKQAGTNSKNCPPKAKVARSNRVGSANLFNEATPRGPICVEFRGNTGGTSRRENWPSLGVHRSQPQPDPAAALGPATELVAHRALNQQARPGKAWLLPVHLGYACPHCRLSSGPPLMN